MEFTNLLSIVGFILLSFLIALFWDRKINFDRKNRKRSSEKFFFAFFGMAAAFVAIDNWLIIGDFGVLNTNKKEIFQESGLQSLFEWWGIYAFIIGIFIGMVILSFVHKRILQTVKRFNIFSFYHFLKIRYHNARNFIQFISKINLILFVPIVFFQVKIIASYLFPELNSYLSSLLISLSFILIFLYVSNRNTKLPYLISFTLLFLWLILSFSLKGESTTAIYLSMPNVPFALTLLFLGFTYYISIPRNFSTYAYKKVENKKVNTINKSLFVGGFLFFLFLFHFIPVGGFSVQQGIPQLFFLLCLSFVVVLSQLFYMKSHLYENFKKYELNSRSLATVWSCGLFIAIVLLGNLISENIELTPSKIYLLTLTYLPVLLPSFFGGFIIKKAKSISLILSYIAGLSVWIYMVIIEDFIGMKIKGLNLDINLVSQTFFPFLASIVFYLLPTIFTRKDVVANSLIKPEENIIQSLLIDFNVKIKTLFNDANLIKVFVLFFDNKDKYFDIDFLTYRTKLSKTKLVGIAETLENEGWIFRKNNFYRYKTQEKELEKNLYKIVTTFHSIENIFRKKVEEDFGQHQELIQKKAEEIDTQVSTVSLLNEISAQFSQIFNFKTLYRKVVELCVSNLGFEGAEMFLIEKKEDGSVNYKPVDLFYSNFRHLMISKEDYEKKVQADEYRKELLGAPFLIINNPKELERVTSFPEKYYALAILTIMQEDEPYAVVQVGYCTEDKTIGSQDKQKLEFLANSMSQNIIIISLYESLEEKIKQRTLELQKTNEDLTQFNNALNVLNKEIKREMIAASAIQKAILPQEIPFSKMIELGCKLKAMPDETLTEAERKKIEISGDYYDIFEIGDGKIGLLIADVTGHGVPSALITTMSKISFYTQSLDGGTTAEICSRVNKEIYEAIGIGDTGFYVTVFFSIYDTNTGILQYTNAGHYEGVIIRNGSKAIERISSEGFFIGSFEGAEYGFNESILRENDKFILYTDGMVELKNPNGAFYEDVLDQKLISFSDKAPQEMVDEIFKDSEVFRQDAPIKDDQTLLVFQPKVIPNPAKELHKHKKISDLGIGEEAGSSGNEQELNKRFLKVVKDFNEKNFSEAFEKEVDEILPLLNNPNIYYIKGMLLKNKDLYEEAIPYFQNVEKLAPQNVSSLNVLALCYYKIKNYNKAKEYWEKVLKIKPDLESAVNNLEVIKKLI